MKLMFTYFTNRGLFYRYMQLARKKKKRLDRIFVALDLMKEGLDRSVILDVCVALGIGRNRASYRLVNDLYRAYIAEEINEDLIKRMPL